MNKKQLPNMKTILAVLFACFILPAAAQPPTTVERVYLQTDKEMYVAGELMWFHATTTDKAGRPQDLSKICYIELLDGTAPLVQAMAPVEFCHGSGAILLPASVRSGAYRLVAYTRYMQNGPQETFFRKNIVVMNPLDPEFLPETGNVPASSAVSAGIVKPTVATGAESYSGRQLVEVEVSGLPRDTEFLSVSVTGCDFTGGFPDPDIAAWREGLRRYENAAQQGSILAEYEGHMVTGRITGAGNGQAAAYNADITPLLAFPGKNINLFVGDASPDGTVVFHTRHGAGLTEAATTFRGEAGSENYRIDLLKPYFEGHENVTGINSVPASGYSPKRVLEQNLATQVQYSFVRDSLNRFASDIPALARKPDVTYIMKDYTRFATMPEVITEFVSWAKFRRVDGKRQLVVSHDGVISNTGSLILLDGIPIADHQIIYDYNPLLLNRIDIWSEQYMFDGRIYYGILSMTSKDGNYPELAPDPFTRIIPYEMPQLPRRFFSPAYDTPEKRASRTPDYRHTLYWNPAVAVDGNGANFTFYTSDLQGEFRITVEGVTSKGEPISAWSTFSVE